MHEYTIIAGDRSYSLPKKTLKVMETLNRVIQIDNQPNMTLKEKFRAAFDFVADSIGRENAVEILGSDSLEEVDLSEVTITFQKIREAYEKPVKDFQNEQNADGIRGLEGLDEISRLADAAEKIIELSKKKAGK